MWEMVYSTLPPFHKETNVFLKDAYQYENLVSLRVQVVRGDCPPEIFDLPKLRFLRFGSEDYDFGPDMNEQLCQWSNWVRTMEGLGKLTNLIHLEIKGVGLKTPILASDIDRLTSLKSLIAIGPEFSTFFPENSVYGLKSLRRLEVTGMDCVPKPLENLALERLLFFQSVFNPSGLERLTTLEELCFTRCNLLGPLPEHIDQLVHLHTFEMSMTSARAPWPPTFTKLTGLEDLTIYSCSIPFFPDVSNFNALRSLRLWENSLSNVAPNQHGFREVVFTEWMTDLTVVRYGGSEPGDHIPPSICRLPCLEKLTISAHDAVLPPGLTKMTTLQSIVLESMPATRLDELSALTRLTSMSLFNMQNVDTLPDLSNLTRLMELKVSAMHLHSLPESLEKAVNLRKLQVYGGYANSLALPDFLCTLTGLTYLKMNLGNSYLPDAMGNLTNLRHLSLALQGDDDVGNLTLPESLTKLTCIEHMAFRAKSLTVPDSVRKMESEKTRLFLTKNNV